MPSLDKTIETKLTALAEEINREKRKNSVADTSNLENQIDLLVYKLYGLTYDEVLIVDSETPITREEYERGGEA